MKKLPDQLLDLLWGGHNIWVATVGPDGTPNVSIKGCGALLDDGHLYFADMFTHKTRENLQHDPRVAVGIHDPERKVAMQVKGRAELIDHGEVFDQVSDRLSKLSASSPAAHEVRGEDRGRVGLGHGAGAARRRRALLTQAGRRPAATGPGAVRRSAKAARGLVR